jgi:hypothetical protein
VTPARWSLALLLLLLGCSRPPTYEGDVAPLLARRCPGCHDGATVPPRLDRYPDAARVAGEIVRAVRRREMPPWGPDDSGRCGSWEDSAWLADGEIRTLAAWAEGGTPRGGPDRPRPAPPSPPSDLTLEPAVPYAPTLGAGAVRCFALGPAGDRLVSALAVSTDPPGAVEQASLYAVSVAPPAPSWACPGAPDGALLVAWSWSSPTVRLPAGSGVRLRDHLVMRTRYAMVAAGASSPAVRMRVALQETAGAEAVVLSLRAPGPLPPGRRQVATGGVLSVDRPLLLGGIVPRMVSLGRTLELRARRGGEERCLAYLGHWSASSQQLFRFRHPTALAAGDQLALSCTFDTSSRDEPVEEQPCEATLYFTQKS